MYRHKRRNVEQNKTKQPNHTQLEWIVDNIKLIDFVFLFLKKTVVELARTVVAFLMRRRSRVLQNNNTIRADIRSATVTAVTPDDAINAMLTMWAFDKNERNKTHTRHTNWSVFDAIFHSKKKTKTELNFVCFAICVYGVSVENRLRAVPAVSFQLENDTEFCVRLLFLAHNAQTKQSAVRKSNT